MPVGPAVSGASVSRPHRRAGRVNAAATRLNEVLQNVSATLLQVKELQGETAKLAAAAEKAAGMQAVIESCCRSHQV